MNLRNAPSSEVLEEHIYIACRERERERQTQIEAEQAKRKKGDERREEAREKKTVERRQLIYRNTTGPEGT